MLIAKIIQSHGFVYVNFASFKLTPKRKRVVFS